MLDLVPDLVPGQMYCWDIRMAWFCPAMGRVPRYRHNMAVIFRVAAPTIEDAIVVAMTSCSPGHEDDPVVWSAEVNRSVDVSSITESRAI